MNTCFFWWSWTTPVKGSFDTHRDRDPQVENYWSNGSPLPAERQFQHLILAVKAAGIQ